MAVASVFGLAASCGYVGDPLPPAFNIPRHVQDLRAVQVGRNLEVQFTIPAKTTEDLPVKNLSRVELRAGRMPVGGWNMDRWLESSKLSAVEKSESGPAEAAVDVAEFAGSEVVVAVRMANAKGRLSAWSNLVTLRIEAPVTAPKFIADSAPEGAEVKWSGFDGNVIVYREGEKIGESATGRFFDARAELGKTYTFSIQASRGAALSEKSAPVSVKIEDRFPPAAPTGLTAAAGPGTVELSWARGMEPDLSHYLVMRAVGGESEFTNIGRVDVPAFTDRDSKPGSRYRYTVIAVDFRNNQSNPSAAVEILIP